jgi:hypothetical protein
MALVNLLTKFVEHSGLSDYQLRINYKERDGRLEFYFEDDDTPRIITIKYEYGTYKYYKGKTAYTRKELFRILQEFGNKAPNENLS